MPTSGSPSTRPTRPTIVSWALILELRPGWRPWYEEAKEEARCAFAFYRAEPEEVVGEEGIEPSRV